MSISVTRNGTLRKNSVKTIAITLTGRRKGDRVMRTVLKSRPVKAPNAHPARERATVVAAPKSRKRRFQ
jgi:hypothetical protein